MPTLRKKKDLKQPNITPQGTRKIQTNEAQKLTEGRKYKDQTERNEIKTRKIIEKINETEGGFFLKDKTDKTLTRLTIKNRRLE